MHNERRGWVVGRRRRGSCWGGEDEGAPGPWGEVVELTVSLQNVFNGERQQTTVQISQTRHLVSSIPPVKRLLQFCFIGGTFA